LNYSKKNVFIGKTEFFSRDWSNHDKISDNDIKEVAKHEMIHLLLERLNSTGEARFINRDEITEANEELVRKLEYIIK